MHSREIEQKLLEFEELCRRKGVPVTMQRRVIFEAVLRRDDHPSAEQIFEAVHERLPRLSRTTVYRTLDTLLEWGVIRRVHLTGVTGRFDGKVERHHHLVCSACGTILDIEDENLDRISLPKQKLQGFKIEDFSVQFLGLCSACRKKK